MLIDTSKPIGEIATQYPDVIPLLHDFGIDYYCRGRRSLRDACESVGLDPAEVSAAMDEVLSHPSNGENPIRKKWTDAPLAELMRFIADRCHAPNRVKADRLTRELRQVAETHKEKHPELRRISALFKSLVKEVLPHMSKEEDVIFPLIAGLEKGVDPAEMHAPGFLGSLTNQVLLEFHEHDVIAEKLRTIRELSNNFMPPPDACSSYRELYHDLAEFARLVQWHMHLENNILLPRAGNLEARLVTRSVDEPW